MKSCYLTLFLDRVDLEDISAQDPSLDIAVNLDMPPEQVRAMGQGKCYLMCQTMEPALQPHQGGELGLGNVQPPLQQIALRGNCLLEACWSIERGQGRPPGAGLCAAQP